MKRIASFCINHDTLTEGMYVSRQDGDVITYDIRMCRPNGGRYLAIDAMHTIEHLFATFARNSQFSEDVVYVGPMGCQTGFYLLLREKVSKPDALQLVTDTFQYIASFSGEIPGSKKEECGNFLSHDLQKAKEYAKQMLPILLGWDETKMTYPL